MNRERLLRLADTNSDSCPTARSVASGWRKTVIACVAMLMMAVALVVCAPSSAQAAESGLKETTLEGETSSGTKVDVNCNYTILSDTASVSIKALYSSTAYSLSLPSTIDGMPVSEVMLSDSTYGSSDMGSIRSLTIKNVDRLVRVICEKTYLEEITVSSCPNLIKADFSLSQRLKTATCSFNTKLTSLDVRNCYALTHLYCQGNALGGVLDVSTNDKLEYLDCTNNKYISSIPDLVTLKNLQTLLCSQNELQSLTLRNLPQLNTVECMYNKLTSLDVAGCPKLEKLLCYDNKLGSLELKTVSALKELDCSENLLTSLDISGNTNLNTLLCNGNRIADVSNLKAWLDGGIGRTGVIEPQTAGSSSSNGGSSGDASNSSSSNPSDTDGKWIKSGNRWWYRYSNGTYPKNARLTLDKKVYRFDSQGWMMTGWVQELGSWYYHDSSGAQVEGWQKIGGKWYYLNPDNGGIMVTGLKTIGGRIYFFAGSGVMQTGWVKSGSNWYYMNSSGAAMSGWQRLGGKWYYLDTSTKIMKTGTQTIDGAVYCLTSSGAMKTGWNKEGDGWHFYGASGAMTFGWQKVGGKWYYLSEPNGVMKTGLFKTDDGKTDLYYANGSGAMQTGWVKSGSNWYYMNSSGAAASGWRKVGGKWYYLDSNTKIMKTGVFKDYGGKHDEVYFANASGAMQTGWQYLDKGKYSDITQTGWYYFTGSGAMARSRWISNKYWVDADGVMKTNSWVDGNKYFVGPDGAWMPNPPNL